MLHYVSTGPRSFGEHPVAPHLRPGWEFYAVIHGRIAPFFETGDQPSLASNTLWVFSPSVNHGWTGERGASSRVVVFHFDSPPPEIAQLAATNGYFSVPLTAKEGDSLHRVARSALPHFWESDSLVKFHSMRILMDLTLIILGKSSAAGVASPSVSSLAKVEAAENWLRSHLSQSFTMADVAWHTGMTEGNLRRLFQIERQCSPKAVMGRLRMKRAEELLQTTDLKLDVIAEECGFVKTSSFCTAFKRLHNLTPAEYRNSMKPSKSAL